MQDYPFKIVEQKWGEEWRRCSSFRAVIDHKKRKFYVMCAGPYVSGALHMGHVRNYTLGDVCARYHRILGDNVLFPMTFDAFGLPVELAARQRGFHPQQWIETCVQSMKRQMDRLGLSIDWERSFSTADEKIWQRTQLLFLKLFKHGYVALKSASVNWCPLCQTTLADTQVTHDGACWRCGGHVEGRRFPQWFYRTSAFVKELDAGLDSLDWPSNSKKMLRNWSGKTRGTLVRFRIQGLDERIECFTTRVEFLYGVGFLGLAMEHPLIEKLLKKNDLENEAVRTEMSLFIEQTSFIPPYVRRSDYSRIEGCFTGYHAINPLSHEQIPIYVTNFVDADFGTGAIVGNPSMDPTDRAFARKYGISTRSPTKCMRKQYEAIEDAIVMDSGPFKGLAANEARRRIEETLVREGTGKPVVVYRLKDWLVSRQRFWGVPIPIVHCPVCGVVPVPGDKLPIRIPKDLDLSTPSNPLASCPSYVNTCCPNCGRDATREVDTLDCMVDVFWHYWAPISPVDKRTLFNEEQFSYWMPVDMAFYGTDVLHFTPNFQFFLYVFYELGLVGLREPFKKAVHHGMVLNQGRKMSKSLGNAVDPDEFIQTYGSDALRLYVVSAARAERAFDWSDDGVKKASETLRLLWNLALEYLALDKEATKRAHPSITDLSPRWQRRVTSVISRTTANMDNQNYHLAVRLLFRLLGALKNECGILVSTNKRRGSIEALFLGLSSVIRMLSPFTPHICEELGQRLGLLCLPSRGPWPDAGLLVQEKRNTKEGHRSRLQQNAGSRLSGSVGLRRNHKQVRQSSELSDEQ